MKEQGDRDRLIPEIKRYEEMIADMKNNIAASEVAIEKEAANQIELNAVITDLESKKDQQKEKYDARQADYIKEKDEPVRLGKGNENLKIAVDHLKNDLANLKKDTEMHEKSKEIEDQKSHELQEKIMLTKNEEKKMDQKVMEIGDGIKKRKYEINDK